MALNVHNVAFTLAVRADRHPKTGTGPAPAGYLEDVEEGELIYTDVFFPACIAYGSTGLPRYMTDKVEVYSGAEQRQSRWAYPKHEYSIKLENLPADEISEIMRLWHICSGDHAAFLFMDPLDHTSSIDDVILSASDVTDTDQVVATATGGREEYELYKYYPGDGSRTKQRRIKYPKLDTLIVAVDGYRHSTWNYSYATGVLTFTTPVGGYTENTDMSNNVLGALSGSPDIQVGDLVYLTGHTNPSDERPSGGNPLRVTVAAAGLFEFEEFDGTAYTPDDFSGVDITIQHALPPAGSVITAGFYFYVPVRFEDGDNAQSEVVAGQRESAFANFDQITLKEVLE